MLDDEVITEFWSNFPIPEKSSEPQNPYLDVSDLSKTFQISKLLEKLIFQSVKSPRCHPVHRCEPRDTIFAKISRSLVLWFILAIFDWLEFYKWAPTHKDHANRASGELRSREVAEHKPGEPGALRWGAKCVAFKARRIVSLTLMVVPLFWAQAYSSNTPKHYVAHF